VPGGLLPISGSIKLSMILSAIWRGISMTSAELNMVQGRSGRLPRISAFGLTNAFLFIVLSFVGRFLFPFGDEPDFEARSMSVIADDHPWWSPYSVFHSVIAGWNSDSSCTIVASPLSLWSQIGSGCHEPIEQILSRFALTLLLVIPLLLPTIFRRSAIRLLDPGQHFSDGEWALRLDALSLALLLPSVVAATGVFAEEQFVVILSLLLILVIRNIFSTAVLLFFIIGLDVGNGLVVFAAACLFFFNRMMVRRVGFRILSIILVAELLIVFIIGFIFIDILTNISFLAEKVSGMISVLSESEDQVHKYPVILRPVITFMTGVYMSAAGVKAFPLYAIFGVAFVQWWRRFGVFRQTRRVSVYGFEQRDGSWPFDETRILLLTAANVILLFVFLLPTYSNAKYYLFLVPFFLVNALQVFERNAIRTLFVSSTIVVFIFLLLYRISGTAAG
jgi:hypothetical protein